MIFLSYFYVCHENVYQNGHELCKGRTQAVRIYVLTIREQNEQMLILSRFYC